MIRCLTLLLILFSLTSWQQHGHFTPQQVDSIFKELKENGTLDGTTIYETDTAYNQTDSNAYSNNESVYRLTPEFNTHKYIEPTTEEDKNFQKQVAVYKRWEIIAVRLLLVGFVLFVIWAWKEIRLYQRGNVAHDDIRPYSNEDWDWHDDADDITKGNHPPHNFLDDV
jgi:hypothetical protein